MKLRDAVRTAVLASNPYWPFSILNKYPYYVAIRAFVRLCAAYPAVKSVYLRSGLVEREWVPALSDIDFTVVIDGKLACESEFSFLHGFWQNFGKYKSCFPMIGEVDILTDENIRSWTRFGLAGRSAGNWQLLHGSRTAQPGSSFEPRWATQDCIDYALNYFYWYCRGYFEKQFYGLAETPYLVNHDLHRLAAKIFRCLQRISPDSGKHHSRENPRQSEHEICARVMVAVEKEIRRLEEFAEAAPADPEAIEWNAQFAAERRSSTREPEASDAAIFAPWRELLDSVVALHNRTYLIFRNDLDISTIAAALPGLRERLGQPGSAITAMSQSVFVYMTRHYQPFEYVNRLRYGKISFGVDLPAHVVPPSRCAYARFILGQIPNLIAFPRSRSFHIDPNSVEIASILERGLALRLYLEHELIAPLPEQFLSECERRYPAQMQALRAFHNGGVLPGYAELFGMFKALTERIHGQLASPSGDGGLIATA